ncbi:MAG: Smr/MutS family protein [Myxococcota bacterium]
MDPALHTQRSLDTAVVRSALVECAATTLGARRLESEGPLPDAAAVREVYAGVAEWTSLVERGAAASLGGVHDIAAAATGARKGEVLEASMLVAVGRTLDAMDRAARRLLAEDTAALVPHLSGIAARIGVDPGLLFDLVSAFEPDGRLSERTYPELGDLRRTIQGIHSTLRTTLTSMAKGEDLSDDLQDTFWTIRNDRYVLPLKPHAKNLGVVHGTSGSGKTVFVEPHEILELNNRLRLAEGRLLAEERRILAALSRSVGVCAPEILASLDAIVELDGLAARAELGRKLGGRPVQVGDRDTVRLTDARHPVLVLRGIDVVGHDLSLTAERPALVLTGPNTGGKTVALKTIGLSAWMVRHGIPLPAAEGSRLDYFDRVLADVGDAQTVSDDLSSFSAQLVAVRGMLAVAGPSTLLLLDELASGTDPGQGAALAQAVLEALVDAGARVVTTTHYPPLKGLPTVDPRFAVAAMEVRDGQPTYVLLQDATGESHALSTAERLGIGAAILERARALKDGTDRGLSRTLEALEEQRAALASQEERVRVARAEVERLQAEVERRNQVLRERSAEIEKAGAADYLERLKKAERAIGAVVAQLQANPSQKAAIAARHTLDAFRGLVPEPEAPEVAPAPRSLAVGDKVRHPALGTGLVEEVGRTVRVRGGAVSFTARPDELELLASAEPAVAPRVTLPPAAVRSAAPELASALRIPGNTVDLRGMRVDEAMDAVDVGLDRAATEGHEVVFVLHGHGTGALKSAVREALRAHPMAKRFAPANADQGGDAYTVVAVR